jgi:HPt (histidine-containing phosphotransfer) domain-containing protein
MTSALAQEWALLLDDDEGRQLLALYAREMPERIKLLERAISTRDYSWLRRLAHQIKGSAGLYGFPELAAKAAELELLIHKETCDTVLVSLANKVIELCRQPQARLERQLEGRA